MKRSILLSLALLVLGCAGSGEQTRDSSGDEVAESRNAEAASSDDDGAVDLIPREVLFGNADRKQLSLSPNGEKLAWLAPDEGVMNVWVAPVDDLDAARAVTEDRDRGIVRYTWAYTNEDILYTDDKGGNEKWHIHRVDLESGDVADLTPWEGVTAGIQELSPKQPGTMLATVNKRDKKLHDLYRIDLESGDAEMVRKNTKNFASWYTDESLEVRLVRRQTETGGAEYLKPDGDGGWEPFLSLSREDTLSTGVVGFDRAGETVYLTDSRGRDKSALVAMPLDGDGEGKSKGKKVLWAPERASVEDVVRHPKSRDIQAATYNYKRENWKVLDDEFGERFRAARDVHDGELGIASRDLADETWVLSFEQDDGPVRYYLYDARQQEAEFLFVHRDDLKNQPLADKKPVVIESRDGLDLVSYLTLPPWKTDDGRHAEKPMPLIVYVHGGPWWRDKWGYSAQQQWLANRGYAVLSVNFRGSTGFGKSFLNAADEEWGGKMHEDLLDARQWAIEQGLTTEDQIGILGGSYGGYATLVGMTMTPDKFVAGVDLVGPSSLVTLLESIPPYWKPQFEMFAHRVGDPRTDEGRKLLEERSPINYVDQIQHPLLIAQGANDPRVKRAESDQIVEAMRQREIPVTYLLYPDEGHGFQKPENKMSYYAVTEQFLAEHLGGRAEPVGDDFSDSSLRVPVGASRFPEVQKKLCEPHPDRCRRPKGEKGEASSKEGDEG